MDNLPLVCGFVTLAVLALSLVLSAFPSAARKCVSCAGLTTFVVSPIFACSSQMSHGIRVISSHRRIGPSHITFSFFTCFPSHDVVRIICSRVYPVVFGPFGSFRSTAPHLT